MLIRFHSPQDVQELTFPDERFLPLTIPQTGTETWAAPFHRMGGLLTCFKAVPGMAIDRLLPVDAEETRVE